MSGICDLDRRGDVFVLHWHDGENRFNRASVDALGAALDEVDAADGPKALVVVGEGKYWSNGLDLEWMGTQGGAVVGPFLDDVHRLLVRALMFPCATVAALNGHAFAGGAMLATAFDFRVMRDDRGYWCLPEADLRLPLTPLMYAVVAAKLPRVTAHEAILSGRRYTSSEAVEAQIVHESAAEVDVLNRAVERAASLAGKGVIVEHKQLMYGDVATLLTAAAPPR